ncbi:hypothetical protein BOX15_Mlig028847g1, partial [Macrostomum lignano]
QQPQQQPGPGVSPVPQVVAPPSAAAPGSYASRVPPSVLRAHRIMGFLQLLTGALVIIINIAGLAVGSGEKIITRYGLSTQFSLVGGGVWSGPFFIAAGISGLSAGRPGGGCTLGCVVTCLVFSIIASVLAFSAMVTEAIVAAENRRMYEYSKSYSSSSSEDVFRAVYGTGIACVLLCAFEFVLAIVHSAFACRASCCCVPSAVSNQQQPHQQVFMTGQRAYVTEHAGPYPGQVVVYPGQQVIFAPQSGHPPPPGYPVQQTGYPGPQAGYPGPQAGYTGQQAGYPGQQAGYPGPQAGYPGPQAGYPGPQAGSSTAPPPYESSIEGHAVKF